MKSGSSFVTILLTALLLALLSGVLFVNFSSPTKGAMQKATRATIQNLSRALDTYAKDNDAYPDPGNGLTNLLVNPGISGWGGPYLTHIPADAWGTPIRYHLVDGRPRLVSAGLDIEFGTRDDITN
jgi:general secretion pathway protein G